MKAGRREKRGKEGCDAYAPKQLSATINSDDGLPSAGDKMWLNQSNMGEDTYSAYSEASEWLETFTPINKTHTLRDVPCAGLAATVRDAMRPLIYLILPESKDNEFDDNILSIIFPDLPELERKLGRALLDAILKGDKTFGSKVAKALTDVKQLFAGRSVCRELADKLVRYMPDIEAHCETKAEIRAFVQEKLGRSLQDEEWNRLHKVMRWDKYPDGGNRGRPRKRITKRPRRKS